MGKIKRERKKLHIEAVKVNPLLEKEPIKLVESSKQTLQNNKDNTLENIRINERPSVKIQSKKSKREQRRERWLKKLDATYTLQEETKKAKERTKTVIVGDMQLLASALPTIPSLTQTPVQNISKDAIQSKKISQKRRQKQQLADLEHFKQVLDHPAFQSNPLSAISEHVKNWIQREGSPT